MIYIEENLDEELTLEKLAKIACYSPFYFHRIFQAIFTHRGPYEGLEEAFDRIFLKWLPDSGEIFDESRTVFCEYFNMEYAKAEPEKLVTELYVPLK